MAPGSGWREEAGCRGYRGRDGREGRVRASMIVDAQAMRRETWDTITPNRGYRGIRGGTGEREVWVDGGVYNRVYTV